MTSPLLALFIRSLREDSRLKFTYFSRAALVFVLLLFLYGAHSSFGWSNAPGLEFFSGVINVDLCAVMLAGLSYFSAAISEEKEEMTLGLLRMTNLNSLSILLGKSTSRLCTALLLFVAQIPFTLLAVTLGGISLHQICAAYVAIGAFLIGVANLALFFSVLCRRSGFAALLTAAGLVFFFLFLPLINWLLQWPVEAGLVKEPAAWTQAFDGLAGFAKEASPFVRVGAILTTGFHESALTFQVWSNLALGAAFFLLAWAVFERFCSEQKDSAPGRIGVPKGRGRWRVLGPGRAWSRALAWKDFYFTTGGKLWLLLKLLIYGAPLVAMRCWPKPVGGPPSWREFGLVTFWLMLIFLFVELAFACASLLRNERQGKTLSSLAMLPQGIHSVVYEKFLGVLPSLAAAGLYLFLSLPMVLKSLSENLRGQTRYNDDGFWFITTLASQALFFLHVVTMLSLYVKRGALPLAIGCHIVLWMLIAMIGTGLSGGGEGFIVLVDLFTMVAVVVLHVQIGVRLEVVAAEE